MFAIKAKNLSKKYEIYRKPSHRLKELATLGRRKYHKELWALKGIDFEIPAGKTIGIIGPNRAGKSTLLRLLAGIGKPSSGEIEINGRVSALLELNAGFHWEFSGRENILMSCSLLGMSTQEINQKYESIVEFSELKDFIELPVWTYSSGMYLRLGFAIATSVDPDILLIDEVLAVGDEYFRWKCFNRINDFKKQGKTIIFVSHDTLLVRNLCNEVIYIDEGKIVSHGNAVEVINNYFKQIYFREREQLAQENVQFSDTPRWGSGEIEIEEVKMFNRKGEEDYVFKTGERVEIKAKYLVKKKVNMPVFGFNVFRSDGVHCICENQVWSNRSKKMIWGKEGLANPFKLAEVGETGEVNFCFEKLLLLEGNYSLSFSVHDGEKAVPLPFDEIMVARKFKVEQGEIEHRGIFVSPGRWALE